MIIYKITNRINGKVYIGQTTKSLRWRWQCHCSKSKGCPLLKRAILKHGRENFTVEQIDTACTREELDAKEIYWIKFYDSMNRDKGYNLTSGGESKKSYSEETRRRMSESHKGQTLSEETRIKMSCSRKGHIVSDITRKKMSDSAKGKVLSEETRRKLRMIFKGRKAWNKGIPMSEERRKKHSDFMKGNTRLADWTKNHKELYQGANHPMARAVVCVETGEVFGCGKQAADKYGVLNQQINACLKGKRKTAAGYHWRYVDD